MVLVVPFVLLFTIAIFGGFLIAAARMLGRLVLSASLALLIGIVTAMMLPHENDSIAIGALIALALTAPIFWLLTPRRTRPVKRSTKSRVQSARVTKAARRFWFSGTRQSDWTSAWTRLEETAPDHAARLLIARRSCERFEAQCEKRHFDLEAHRSLVIIRKRVPDLITQELDRAEPLSDAGRGKVIQDLVELVERVAADCERRLIANRDQQAGEDSLLRRHLENYLAGDTLSALKP